MTTHADISAAQKSKQTVDQISFVSNTSPYPHFFGWGRRGSTYASTRARPSPIGSQVNALECFDAKETAAVVADDILGVGTRVGMTWTQSASPARRGEEWSVQANVIDR